VRLRFTLRAARQIDEALDHVAAHSPQGARNVQGRLRAVLDLLQRHPGAGSPTSRAGVRRAFLMPYPYSLDYRVTRDEVVVQRFRHTAREPL
jgi:plasmid stabilization system protein ParE